MNPLAGTLTCLLNTNKRCKEKAGPANNLFMQENTGAEGFVPSAPVLYIY